MTEQDCKGLDRSTESISTVHSPAAVRIANAFATQIAADANRILDEEDNAFRKKLQDDRKQAEEAYQAAKERKERTKPVPRAKLHHIEPFAGLIPAIRYNSLIAEYYAVETNRPNTMFVRDGKLTHFSEALLNTLDKVDDHALDIESYAPDKLRAMFARLEQMRAALAHVAALNDDEIDTISKALENSTHPFAPSGNFENARNDLNTAVQWLCDEERTPVPRAAAMCKKSVEYRREIRQLENALEFALADAWMAYAAELKFGNLERFSDAEREKYASEDNPNEIHPKYHGRIVEERLAAALKEYVELPDRTAAEAYFESLIPKHAQYAKLQAQRDRYRKIVEDGGWAVVPPDRMFAGGHAPLVKNLKNRLAIEGYYTGTIDDAFDAPLTDAIKKYQKYHQLEETGEVGEVFWRSLNVPAAQRLAEIEVNIRRWHKTLFEPTKQYAYVNIPSFSVELWDGDERVAVHKAVVGNSTKICNTRTREWELMNSTRLMHARLSYIVFNPYWNVPPRIEVDEFLPKMAADPKWLENSDYEYVTPRGGGRVLRQKPGENNSLGKVKLIFPNRYNIYFHDTPKQGMFEYPVRAFSHGCIRVEKAMDFAQKVLEMKGQWDKKEVEQYFKQKGEHAVDLNTPLDVFIEYHTVTVDENDQPYFLADVYKIIRDEITPPTAAQRRCDPAVDKTSAFRSGGADDSGP